MVKIERKVHGVWKLCLSVLVFFSGVYGTLYGADVYIMDTGVRSDHEKFQAVEVLSKDLLTETDNPGRFPYGNHGSLMAGLIVDRAPSVQLISIRPPDENGEGTWASFLKGIHWITNHHEEGVPAVANLSLGGMSQDKRIQKILSQSINKLVADGVTVVVAAGNEGKDKVDRMPSTLDSVISVGAVSFFNERLNESNYGSCVDVYVLGEDLSGPSATSPTSLIRESGTSVAAAVLTGHVAAYLRLHQQATPEEVKDWVIENSERGKVKNFRGSKRKKLEQESLLFGKK